MEARPNVVLLVLDSVRAANVSCYGYERQTTPHIDALAREGTLYEDAISVGCWTLPVHASLFTGLYPSSHGVTEAKDSLPADATTLAGRLEELGYRTACFSTNPYISDATGLTQGFGHVDDLWRRTNPHLTRSRPAAWLKRLERRRRDARLLLRAVHLLLRPRTMLRTFKRWRSVEDRGARLANERIKAWLSESRNDSAPFFVFVNYMDSHEPRSPGAHNRRFMPPRVTPWRLAGLSTSRAEVLARPPERRAQDLALITSLYDGALAYLDARVGELMAYLSAEGLAEDTVVIVTSDHGDLLGEHEHIGHRLYLYENLVRVPLVVRHPSRFAAHARIGHQVQIGDLFPTILELAGDTAPSAGFKSLLGIAGGGRHDVTVAENTAPESHGRVEMQMIRGERYKYISKSDGEDELYDLREDPGELENLASSRPDIAGELRERLGAWQRTVAGDSLEAGEADYDEETLRRLRGLGYVG